MAPRISQGTLQTKLAAHRQFLRGIHGGDRLVLKLHDAVIAPSLAEIGGTISDILHQHSIWVRTLALKVPRPI